jgi:Icc-related predicted phosphoesterase
MNALFTSDIHGLVVAYLQFAEMLKGPSYDIGIIAGDLTSGFKPEDPEISHNKTDVANDGYLEELNSPNEGSLFVVDMLLAKAYLEKETEFKAVLSQARKPVFFIMGNDDGLVTREWTSEGQIQNINQRRIEIGDMNIVGYQYTNPFVGGLFEKTERQQKNDYKKLLELVDSRTILVTHGPAYGFFDQASGYPWKDSEVSIGSRALRWLIDRTRPKLHLYGHIHKGFGINGKEINGAYPLQRKFIGIDLNSSEAKVL